MKKFTYILLLLSFSCGGNKDGIKVTQKPAINQSVKQHFDKQILPVKQNANQVQDSLSQENFDELAKQTITRFFDMINLTKQTQAREDFLNFTAQNAQKLWLKPENAKTFLQQSAIQSPDSLKLHSLSFQNFESQENDEILATYRLYYFLYRRGQRQSVQTKAKVYFKILYLNLDGQNYLSLKAKIFRIGE